MPVERRSLLALMAGGVALLSVPTAPRAEETARDRKRAIVRVKNGSNAPKFVQPPLPFADTALAPVVSQQTVQLHYGKHHAGYYANLNRLVRGTVYEDLSLTDVVRRSSGIPEDKAILNQAGQALNHELYWEQFRPGGATMPGVALRAKIDADFGGFGKLKDRLVAAAGSLFGSGWIWLVQDAEGRLASTTTPNGNNPLEHDATPLLAIDVWEHAYYLDYQNRRADHVRAALDGLVNWDVVAGRLKSA